MTADNYKINSRYSLFFNVLYGYLDFNGKTVVDIGGYTGDSADYFLNRGASHVYIFESDPKAIEKLQVNFQGERSELVTIYPEAWNGQLINADILKMDCEGCEIYLDESILQRYPQWVVGIHPLKIGSGQSKRLRALLEANRGTVVIYEGLEQVWSNYKSWRPTVS